MRKIITSRASGCHQRLRILRKERVLKWPCFHLLKQYDSFLRTKQTLFRLLRVFSMRLQGSNLLTQCKRPLILRKRLLSLFGRRYNLIAVSLISLMMIMMVWFKMVQMRTKSAQIYTCVTNLGTLGAIMIQTRRWLNLIAKSLEFRNKKDLNL